MVDCRLSSYHSIPLYPCPAYNWRYDMTFNFYDVGDSGFGVIQISILQALFSYYWSASSEVICLKTIVGQMIKLAEMHRVWSQMWPTKYERRWKEKWKLCSRQKPSSQKVESRKTLWNVAQASDTQPGPHALEVLLIYACTWGELVIPCTELIRDLQRQVSGITWLDEEDSLPRSHRNISWFWWRKVRPI